MSSPSCDPRATPDGKSRAQTGHHGQSKTRIPWASLCVFPAQNLVSLVVRGRIELPTFRFSGLGSTAQDRPRRSLWLLSGLRWTPVYVGV